MNDIPIWVTDVPIADRSAKGIFTTDARTLLKRIPLDSLRASLGETCHSVVNLLQGIRDDLGDVAGFKLKQVALQVEINAEGGVELVGTAKVGAKGAVTLTFGD